MIVPVPSDLIAVRFLEVGDGAATSGPRQIRPHHPAALRGSFGGSAPDGLVIPLNTSWGDRRRAGMCGKMVGRSLFDRPPSPIWNKATTRPWRRDGKPLGEEKSLSQHVSEQRKRSCGSGARDSGRTSQTKPRVGHQACHANLDRCLDARLGQKTQAQAINRGGLFAVLRESWRNRAIPAGGRRAHDNSGEHVSKEMKQPPVALCYHPFVERCARSR